MEKAKMYSWDATDSKQYIESDEDSIFTTEEMEKVAENHGVEFAVEIANYDEVHGCGSSDDYDRSQDDMWVYLGTVSEIQKGLSE